MSHHVSQGEELSLTAPPAWKRFTVAQLSQCGPSCLFVDYYDTAWYAVAPFFIGCCAGGEALLFPPTKPYDPRQGNAAGDGIILFYLILYALNIYYVNSYPFHVPNNAALDEGILYACPMLVYALLLSLTFAPPAKKDEKKDEKKDVGNNPSASRSSTDATTSASTSASGSDDAASGGAAAWLTHGHWRRYVEPLSPTALLRSRPIGFIAEISMPLYLSHLVVERYIAFLTVGLPGYKPSAAQAWLTVVAAVPICILIGWYLTHHFEAPAGNGMLAFLTGKPSKPRKLKYPLFAKWAWRANRMLFGGLCMLIFIQCAYNTATYRGRLYS